MAPLRNITIGVIEPAPGHFVWQLREAKTPNFESWTLIKEAREGKLEWLDAFNDGFDEVLLLAQDGRSGPR